MTISELWRRARDQDERYTRRADYARAKGLALPTRDQLITVQVQTKDGALHPGVILKARTGVEITHRHVVGTSQPERFRQVTSCIIPGGFKVSTLGGTVNFDTNGRGTTRILDEHGQPVEIELTMRVHKGVQIEPSGKLTVEQMDDGQLAFAVRQAVKADEALKETIEAALDANRHLL